MNYKISELQARYDPQQQTVSLQSHESTTDSPHQTRGNIQ